MHRPPLVLTILLALAGLPAICMVAITMWSVVGRYVFNSADPQVLDFQTLGFTWTVMLAMGAALAWRHQPMASGLPQWHPPAWQRIASALVALVTMLCFAALTAVAASGLQKSVAAAERTPTDTFPVWPDHLGAVVGLTLAAVVFFGLAIVRFRGHAVRREMSK